MYKPLFQLKLMQEISFNVTCTSLTLSQRKFVVNYEFKLIEAAHLNYEFMLIEAAHLNTIKNID